MVKGRALTRCDALVSQLAEETDSKPVQCEFESHRGHRITPAQSCFSVETAARVDPWSAISILPDMGERSSRAGVEDRWHRSTRRSEEVARRADGTQGLAPRSTEAFEREPRMTPRPHHLPVPPLKPRNASVCGPPNPDERQRRGGCATRPDTLQG